MMRFKSLLALVLALPCLAFAQGQSASAPAVRPVSSLNHGELLARLLQLQQGQVVAAARAIVDQPVFAVLQQAAAVVQQRVAADQRTAILKDLEGEARRYAEDVTPILRDSMQRLAGPTMTPLIEERFNDDEMRELIRIFESPVLRKYEQLAPELQKNLHEKLLADVRSRIEERFNTFKGVISRRLNQAVQAGAGGAASGAASGAARKK